MRQKLLDAHEARRPKSEDIQKHLRKGMPGEHREKLLPDTVEKLNAIFERPLERFGYRV
jgi:hypothetical protein